MAAQKDTDIDVLLRIENLLRYHLKPPFARDFDVFAGIQIAATGGGDLTVVSFQVPKGVKGVLKAVGQDADQPNVFVGNSTWKVEIDGSAQTGWGGVNTQVGTVENPEDVVIPVSENQTIKLTCSLTDAANISLPVNVYGRLKGYYWPVSVGVNQ
ncbi:MAG: hypothetical protein M0Z52_07335 [Actinomycetota bacterium]|nr:hypothetical protein [Actinomycetota bacterium]